MKARCRYCKKEVEMTEENIIAHAFGICLRSSEPILEI